MDLSERQKSLLFWASFVSLAAAGVGFVLRVMVMGGGEWGREYGISAAEQGAIFGLSLWPIAVTMILFSLVIDRVGYRTSMFLACGLQLASVVLTVLAKDVSLLKWGCFLGGLGHGIIEACINPLCAAMYTTTKSKMLNILHASWPAGIVAGGITYILIGESLGAWQNSFWIMIPPILLYGAVFWTIHKYPVDERVAANVSNREMLREFGALGAFLAITFVTYELTNQILGLSGASGGWIGENLLTFSGIVGVVGGLAFGASVGALGKWLFFFLCLIMIPLAATELGTDAWIRSLMEPVLGAKGASWAIVASAGIMMVLRFFAGIPLKYISPPALLLVSSVFSMLGLYVLAGAAGNIVFLAFTLYAVGQTFYWPTMLGFVAERFPRGGAMTLNTVSAMGLLTIGIFGAPFLGAVKDSYDAETVTAFAAEAPGFEAEAYVAPKKFFFVEHDSVVITDAVADPALSAEEKVALEAQLGETARSTLKVAAGMPASMALAFLLILLWFKARGGYRAVELLEQES
ncbi:MAG: MFS transporter [Planctomycetota bacterium]|nr:MFS transporter [Planctomycetota bacterium]